jgi:hypothetical protein
MRPQGASRSPLPGALWQCAHADVETIEREDDRRDLLAGAAPALKFPPESKAIESDNLAILLDGLRDDWSSRPITTTTY